MKKISWLFFLILLCPQFAFTAVFSINDLSYSEASRTYSFTLTAKATSASPCTKNQTYSVNYATADGTATAGSDYTATSGTSTKSYTSSTRTSGNCWTQTIAVVVNEDTLYESDETFYVNLSNASSNATISDSQGVGTIINDDTAPSLSISSDITHSEGNSGTTTYEFTITQNKTSNDDTTVYFSTQDDTAQSAYDDYTSISNQLVTISAGSTTATVTVLVNGDTVYEPTEKFTVAISDPTNATLGTSTRTGYITNDDSSSNARDYTLVYQKNVNGNMQIIGNSVKLVQGGTCAPASTNNNSLTIQDADLDSDSNSTINSTSADLVLPAGVTSNDILYAYLYWQGRSSDKDYIQYGTKVKIKPYGYDNYQIISSIDSKFNWIDGDYQGVADVTSLIKASISSESNTTLTSSGYEHALWVADVYSPRTNNGFGAWSLVIVYQDSTDTLKNLSVYDGYQEVPSARTATLSGFLTPTSGDVNSKFFIFAGEGDISYTGDSVSLTNSSGTAISLGNNVFQSSEDVNGTNVTNRNPSCSNTIGIDIRTFYVGTNGNPSIIGNGQTSTTINITTSTDNFFPGVFAFSTELYQPDVCYSETVTYTDLTVGQNITYDVNITNTSYESAKGVTIQKIFGDDDGISYVSGSMKIAPIPGTSYAGVTDSATDSDTANYDSDTNTSTYYLGSGATSSAGGTIAYGKITGLQYTAKITDTNINENTYYVSYTNEQLGITFSGIQISKCTDFNNSLTAASASLGKFNVVNKNFSGTTDSNESNSSSNALYTQLAGQNFQVKVLALDSDYITLKSYTGDVNLSLIKQPSYVTGDDTGNQALCEAATSLSSITTVNFAAQSSKTVTLSYDTAYKDVAFKLAYKESNTSTALSYVCSRDSFAIRPATYFIATSPIYTKTYGGKTYKNVLTGGKTYTLEANATTNSAVTSGYDQNITTSSTDKNATMNLIIPAGCTLDANLTSINLSFSSGTATNTTFVYNNIGDINVTVVDNNWTAIDQNTNSDCIADSNTSTANSDGKIGCLIRNFTLLHFLPKQFKNTFAIANFNSGNFTYLSNDNEMNATASLTATAVLENNTTTATNYTAKCYAQDIDYNISLITNPSGTMWGSNYDTAINRIYFMESSTSHSDANATGQASFSSSEGNFTNGSATVTMFFNFDRNSTLPDQPFIIGKTDFNITSLVDSNNTNGTDFNRTDANTTSLFYYGRAFAPDYTFVTTSGTAKIYYEVYCKDCNSSYRTTMGIDGNESVHAINWYQNTNHAPSTMGTIAPVPSTTSKFSSYDANTTANPSTQTLSSIAASVPFTDKINLNSDTWLQYYPTYYTVTFTNSGNWAGAGTVKSSSSDTNVTGATIDATIKSGTRIQKRLNW